VSPAEEMPPTRANQSASGTSPLRLATQLALYETVKEKGAVQPGRTGSLRYAVEVSPKGRLKQGPVQLDLLKPDWKHDSSASTEVSAAEAQVNLVQTQTKRCQPGPVRGGILQVKIGPASTPLTA